MIDIKTLWCDGIYRRRTSRANKGTICPDWKRDRCPCYPLNKPEQDFVTPLRYEINWRRKKAFQNCQNYKLK